jgi:branched-chain amino acid transport system ATP-binding protein
MLLSIENLHVGYGLIEALHGVTFNVKKGEIVTLIGANGAGKSTTLMSIMRLPPPEAPVYRSGKMIYEGQDLHSFLLITL